MTRLVSSYPLSRSGLLKIQEALEASAGDAALALLEAHEAGQVEEERARHDQITGLANLNNYLRVLAAEGRLELTLENP